MDNEIMVYIPELKIFLFVAEGSGDNLSVKDIENGSVDYSYIETYNYENRELVEVDGGIQLLPKSFKEMYPDIKDCLNDAMEFMFNSIYDYIIIERDDEDK